MAENGDQESRRQEEYAAYEKEYGKMPLQQLAMVIRKMTTYKDSLEAEVTDINKRLQWLTINHIPTVMENQGLEDISFQGIGKLKLVPDLWAAIPAPTRDEAFEWLKANGHAGLIKDNPTVNAQTFKAFCREQLKKGRLLPSRLFRVEAFTKVTLKEI